MKIAFLLHYLKPRQNVLFRSKVIVWNLWGLIFTPSCRTCEGVKKPWTGLLGLSVERLITSKRCDWFESFVVRRCGSGLEFWSLLWKNFRFAFRGIINKITQREFTKFKSQITPLNNFSTTQRIYTSMTQSTHLCMWNVGKCQEMSDFEHTR